MRAIAALLCFVLTACGGALASLSPSEARRASIVSAERLYRRAFEVARAADAVQTPADLEYWRLGASALYELEVAATEDRPLALGATTRHLLGMITALEASRPDIDLGALRAVLEILLALTEDN